MTQASDAFAQLQSAVTDLQAENGVVITEINDLVAQGQANGSVPVAGLLALADTIRGEVGKLGAAVQSAQPAAPVTPGTPATPPAPAGP